MLKINNSSMEELNMYENINECGGTPGSAAPADVPLDDLPSADNFSEITADVPWRDDPPDGGYYSYSEYGESGIDECRQPDSVRAKNQKENTEMVSFRVPKGKKAEYKALAGKTGKSLSSLIIDMLEEKLKEEH